MSKRKQKIPPSKARYMEREPIVSFHMPREVKLSLEQQSKDSNMSLSGLLLKIVTNASSAQECRKGLVKQLIEQGKIIGYNECKALHEETKNCCCESCFEKKISYLNLIIKSKNAKSN